MGIKYYIRNFTHKKYSRFPFFLIQEYQLCVRTFNLLLILTGGISCEVLKYIDRKNDSDLRSEELLSIKKNKIKNIVKNQILLL